MGLFLKGLGTFWHHLKIRLSSNLQISQGAEKQLKHCQYISGCSESVFCSVWLSLVVGAVAILEVSIETTGVGDQTAIALTSVPLPGPGTRTAGWGRTVHGWKYFTFQKIFQLVAIVIINVLCYHYYCKLSFRSSDSRERFWECPHYPHGLITYMWLWLWVVLW